MPVVTNLIHLLSSFKKAVLLTIVTIGGVTLALPSASFGSDQSALGALAAPGALEIESFFLNANQVAIKLSLPMNGKTVYATYLVSPVTNQGQNNRAMLDPVAATEKTKIEKFWNRLWFEQGDSSLTSQEQNLIRTAMQKNLRDQMIFDGTLQNAPLLSQEMVERAQQLGHFLTEFLAPNSELEPFDRGIYHQGFVDFDYDAKKWTMICELIGQVGYGEFPLNGQLCRQQAVVGEQATRCRGRCGKGCDEAGQIRKRQYTQECLNHDLCHDANGQQLGPCKDLFWKAVPGFLFAPNCP